MTHAHGFGTFPDDLTAVPTTAGGDRGPEGAHRSEAGEDSVPAVVPELSVPHEVDDDDAGENLAAQVEQPAKVMRIGTMIKQLLEEVRAAPLDEAGRRRLAEIHASSIRELESGLSPELRDELGRLTLPFGTDDGHVPSEPELRIAQAQLVGWLEGLFHGIQTAMVAQQMVARQQLEELRRRALPAGSAGPGGPGGQQTVIVGPGGQILGPGSFGGPPPEDGHGTGQYL